MIRPITIEEFNRLLSFYQHIDWEGWLAGAVIGVVIVLLLHIAYLHLSVKLNRDKTRIVIVPAQSDSNSVERMNECFVFLNTLLRQRPLLSKALPSKQIALEITATPQTGMQYQLYAPPALNAAVIQGIKSIFQGAKVYEAQPVANSSIGLFTHFKLRHHPALPLRIVHKEHVSDPHSFIASSLAELKDGEHIVIQLILRPLGGWRSWMLHKTKPEAFNEQSGLVEHKLSQVLFASSLRLSVNSREASDARRRKSAVTSGLFGLNQPKTQELQTSPIWLPWHSRLARWGFRHRSDLFSPSLTLSSEELASLVHPASGHVAKSEDVGTNKSKLLPLPTELKARKPEEGVVIGSAIGSANNYPIVLTDDDRSRHMYLLGQTGSGKSTILFHMARKDIADGHGVAVIDPHGDLIDDLLSDLVTTVGRERVNEAEQRVVLIDPSDLQYPVGINLLELPKGITNPDELALEQELVCEGVISVFKRVFNQEEEANAHRIEYILRNVIHTAFTIPGATIFTLYDLVNDPKYRKTVLAKLEDQNLLNFWKNEFLKSGDWQQVKMVSGVTAKIGRFLFSPTVKRILEQPHSTIDFDEALAKQKVLLCNLSEGKIGEDNSHLMGAVIITKIHLAALRRARLEQSARSAFYLYVDEFQHFATSYFTRLLSGGRKFGLRVIIAQQSTAQLKDKQMIQVILANTGTVITFRTASSQDADLIVPLFEPMANREDIVNLPRHYFYTKLGSNQAQSAFSGLTSPITIHDNPEGRASLIAASRRNHTRAYEPVAQPRNTAIEAEREPRRKRQNAPKFKAKGGSTSQPRLT